MMTSALVIKADDKGRDRMTGTVEVSGLVINSMPVGEQDKRITLLTKEKGKISAFARGARRTGNSLMGNTRLFAYGSFSLFEGRDSFNLRSAQISNYFEQIYEDVEASCYASYFLELTCYYARAYEREPELLKLLYVSLNALLKPSIPRNLTRRIFEIRIMVIEGEYNETPPLKDMDKCKYTWHYICTSPIEKLYTFTISPETLKQLEMNVDAMMEKYIDRSMNSLEILKSLS